MPSAKIECKVTIAENFFDEVIHFDIQGKSVKNNLKYENGKIVGLRNNVPIAGSARILVVIGGAAGFVCSADIFVDDKKINTSPVKGESIYTGSLVIQWPIT